MTTGLKEAILEFFPGNPLARARQGSDAVQVARQGGAPGVPRTCSSDMYSDMLKQLSAYSKEPGESGGSAAWRGFNAGQVARPGRLRRAGGAQFCCNIAATRVNHGAILNQIVGEVQCRESLHSRYLSL